MAGLISTLEISRNTLLNQQLMIQTASNNVANAGTDGRPDADTGADGASDGDTGPNDRRRGA